MALTAQQREARVASLAKARAARAANKTPEPETVVAAPENLSTTIAGAEGEDVDPAILARAQSQLAERTATEQEAATAERAKRGVTADEPSQMVKGKLKESQTEALAARAARQRALAGQVEQPLVKVRITKMGDGKVSMGIHIGGIGEAYHVRGETPSLPRDVALALEARGFAEIQDGEGEPED